MGKDLNDFAAAQKELCQLLTQMSTQLAMANKMITTELPRARALFQELNDIAKELGIERRNSAITAGGLHKAIWEDRKHEKY